ncbi:hypothetical protein C1H76_7678 [Elsinoe australis]|uniref:Uncharacterized protein n=1 Tax=Elsinoe australis TaxID=40998 RepID=A0A4U7AYT6_9PEZI|nr:hypothetical protein C1H76_7678 [Elsinoe australis]
MPAFSFTLLPGTQPKAPPTHDQRAELPEHNHEQAAELPEPGLELDKLRKDYADLARLHHGVAAENYQLQSENHALRAQLKESEDLQKNYQHQIDDAHFEIARLERVIREADMDPVDADRVGSLQQLEEGRKARS